MSAGRGRSSKTGMLRLAVSLARSCRRGARGRGGPDHRRRGLADHRCPRGGLITAARGVVGSHDSSVISR